VEEDPIDHGPWRDTGDEAHHATAGGARERVDRNELLPERRQPAGGRGGPEPRRGNDRGRRLGLGQLGLKVVHVAEAARDGRLEEIDNVPLGHTYRWKIAFHYQPFDAPTSVGMFQRTPLLHALGMPLTDKETPLRTLYRRVGEQRPPGESIFDDSARLWRQCAMSTPCEVRLPEPAVRKGLLLVALGAAPFPETLHGSKEVESNHQGVSDSDFEPIPLVLL